MVHRPGSKTYTPRPSQSPLKTVFEKHYKSSSLTLPLLVGNPVAFDGFSINTPVSCLSLNATCIILSGEEESTHDDPGSQSRDP